MTEKTYLMEVTEKEARAVIYGRVATRKNLLLFYALPLGVGLVVCLFLAVGFHLSGSVVMPIGLVSIIASFINFGRISHQANKTSKAYQLPPEVKP